MGTAAGIAAAVGAAASVASAANAIASDGSGNTVQSQSGPPAWLQQYYQQAAGLAGNVGKTPLRQYQGPMVAGFSPMQLEAMQGVQNAQGLASPYINTAAQYASSAGTPISVPGQYDNLETKIIGNAGLANTGQAGTTNVGAAGQPGINRAYGAFGTAQNGVEGGIGSINRAVGMGSPKNYAGSVQQYMSPYTQDVVNATQAQFNNQNAQQQQGVIGNAISSGAWGGDRASVAQGITAGQQALAQAPVIAGLYNQGYTNAQGQLNQQQAIGLQGGQAAGNLSLGAGQLGSNIGLQAASLGQQGAYQSAGLQQQTAQNQLNFMNQQQQQGIGAQEASGWLGANTANIYGALGQQAQSGALTDASALWSMGQQQQGLHQQQLNIPYEQFQQQQAYPFQVAGWQANILEGLGSGAGGTSSTTYPGPSGVGQALGGLTSAAGYLGQSGLFGGSRYDPYVGAPTVSMPDPVSTDLAIPAYTASAHGGRIGKADGGRPGIPNGPFGMFAAPMKREFAAGGGTGGQGGQARLQLSAPVHYVGQEDGSRGISHPMLSMPTSARIPTDSTYNLPQMAADYTPPSVGSLKYTSTYFPSLNGQSGDPSTKTIVPVNYKGQWMTPQQKSDSVTAGKNPNIYTGPVNNLTQAYEEFLHRQPDPGGLAYWSGMPLSQAIAGIKASQEALGHQSDPSFNPPTPTYATGGAARRPFDSGGAAADSAAGLAMPVGGGSPVAQGTLSNLRGMPPEKLQELSVRFPPNSQYGSMIRRAIQLSRNAPSQGQQEFSLGGRLRRADGGGLDAAFTDFDQVPGDPTRPLDYAPETIFDDAGLAQNLAGKGIITPVTDGEDSHTAPSPRQRHHNSIPPAPSGGPTVPPPPIAAGAPAGSPAGGGLGQPMPAAPPPRSDDRPSAVDPWRQLIAMGSGMMASTSPYASVAIGEGLQAGLKEGDRQKQEAFRQQQADNESLWKNKDIDLRVKDLDATMDYHNKELTQKSQDEADRKQAEQDRNAIDKQRLGIEGQTAAATKQNADAHTTEAGRGYWEPARPLLDDKGQPLKDGNGVPQAVWVNRYTGDTKQGPLADPTIMGGKGAGSTMAMVNKITAENPGMSTVDALARVHDPSDHYAKTIGMRARDEAFRGALADPAFQGDPDGTIDRYLAKYAPSAPASAAGKTDAPGAAAAPKLTPIIQNGSQYDPITHAYLGPAP